MAGDNGTTSTGRITGSAPDPSFRDVLTAAIETAPISKREIGQRIGRTEQAISQWLNKGDMPGLDIVFKLENALDLRLGVLVRHHSPDVWVILESKTTGRDSWPPLSWDQKVREGLIEAPFTKRQREIVLDIVQSYVEVNILASRRPDDAG